MRVRTVGDQRHGGWGLAYAGLAGVEINSRQELQVANAHAACEPRPVRVIGKGGQEEEGIAVAHPALQLPSLRKLVGVGSGQRDYQHVARDRQVHACRQGVDALAQRLNTHLCGPQPRHRRVVAAIARFRGGRPGHAPANVKAALRLHEENCEEHKRAKRARQRYEPVLHADCPWDAESRGASPKLSSNSCPRVSARARLGGLGGPTAKRCRSPVTPTPASLSRSVESASCAERASCRTVSARAAGRRRAAISRSTISANSIRSRSSGGARSICCQLIPCPACAGCGRPKPAWAAPPRALRATRHSARTIHAANITTSASVT